MLDKIPQIELERRLKDPIFLATAQNLCDQYSEEWRSTAPDQTEIREQLYLKQLVLVDVVEEIQNQWVSARVGADQLTEAELDLKINRENYGDARL